MPKTIPLPWFEHAAFDVVVIASSLGGPGTLRRIFSALPPDFPAPIVVVQHLSAQTSVPLHGLVARSRLPLEWASEGARLRAGTVYLASPGRHLRVTRTCSFRLSDEPRVGFSRPSADLLFASAAESFGPRTLGAVLGGRLSDGTAGAVEIRRAGGVVLAQDPETCIAPSMPQSALRQGGVDFVLPPEGIVSALVSLVMVPGARALFGVQRRVAWGGAGTGTYLPSPRPGRLLHQDPS
ncbi:MAG TPA: chemotaxis protein CheB [Thermoanaerobaculia bacterium]|nr:chemotaxis protein CheB [Thermoanaerobaculia bacterium]